MRTQHTPTCTCSSCKTVTHMRRAVQRAGQRASASRSHRVVARARNGRAPRRPQPVQRVQRGGGLLALGRLARAQAQQLPRRAGAQGLLQQRALLPARRAAVTPYLPPYHTLPNLPPLRWAHACKGADWVLLPCSSSPGRQHKFLFRPPGDRCILT